MGIVETAGGRSLNWTILSSCTLAGLAGRQRRCANQPPTENRPVQHWCYREQGRFSSARWSASGVRTARPRPLRPFIGYVTRVADGDTAAALNADWSHRNVGLTGMEARERDIGRFCRSASS